MKHFILIFVLSVFAFALAVQKDYNNMSKKELLQEQAVVNAMIDNMDEMKKMHEFCEKHKNDEKCKMMKPKMKAEMEACRKDKQSSECKKMHDKRHKEMQEKCVAKYGKEICKKIQERRKEEREKFKGKKPPKDMGHKKDPKEFKKHMERKYAKLKEEKREIEKALKGKK